MCSKNAAHAHNTNNNNEYLIITLSISIFLEILKTFVKHQTFKIFLDNFEFVEIDKIMYLIYLLGIHVIMNTSGFNSGSSPGAGLQVLAQSLTHLQNNCQFL